MADIDHSLAAEQSLSFHRRAIGGQSTALLSSRFAAMRSMPDSFNRLSPSLVFGPMTMGQTFLSTGSGDFPVANAAREYSGAREISLGDKGQECPVDRQTGMSALRICPANAAPRPNLGSGAETGVDRVHAGVTAATVEVFIIPNQVVVRFDLPKSLPGSSQQTIGFPRGVAFPAFQHLTQGPSSQRTHDDMQMIRHYHPGEQIIPRPGKESERVRHQFGDFWAAQEAVAVSGVEIVVHARGIPAKKFFLLRPCERTARGFGLADDVGSFLFELPENLAWQRAGQAERNKVSATFAFEMRQVIARMQPCNKRIGVTGSQPHCDFLSHPDSEKTSAKYVGQTFLSAGRGDFPVASAARKNHLAWKLTRGHGTGMSREPAGSKACPTFNAVLEIRSNKRIRTIEE